MLFAFDLDKTIVTSDFELPDPIADAIKAVRARGHHVSVLTGRPRMAMTEYLDKLGLTDCYSSNHGALVIGTEGEVLRQQRLSAEHVLGLLETFHDHPDIEFSCVVDDTLYVKNPDDARWAWAHTANRRVERYLHGSLETADKLVFSANGMTKTIAAHVAATFPDFVTYPWDDGYLEVTGPESDKGSALALLAALLGYEAGEVVAFGDGPNDVSMLSWAGWGVAVGERAHPDVLAVADERVAPPEELGVAKWLERNVLGETPRRFGVTSRQSEAGR
jgi:5-amino-6-(5-phospho-D-ribitylamino)uracil phosphatase